MDGAGSGLPAEWGLSDMSGSIGIAQDWFAVMGSQSSRLSSLLGEESTTSLRWPQVSVLEMGPSASAPACARRHVTSVLAEWRVAPDLVSDASLITSELVSNAARASVSLDVPSPVGLRLLGSAQRVVIEVWDCGPGAPVRRALPALDDEASFAESGRGLQIVENLANQWGCRWASAHVKAVWAELLIPRAAQRRVS